MSTTSMREGIRSLDTLKTDCIKMESESISQELHKVYTFRHSVPILAQ